jgi:hypothetical protein
LNDLNALKEIRADNLIFDSLLFEEYQANEQLLINRFDNNEFQNLINYLNSLINRNLHINQYEEQNDTNYLTLTKNFNKLTKAIEKPSFPVFRDNKKKEISSSLSQNGNLIITNINNAKNLLILLQNLKNYNYYVSRNLELGNFLNASHNLQTLDIISLDTFIQKLELNEANFNESFTNTQSVLRKTPI